MDVAYRAFSCGCKSHVKVTPSAILVYNQLVNSMVLCVVIGCSKRSGRDKDVSFFRIPKVISNRGKREHELTKRRRAGFQGRSQRHSYFHIERPVYLYDEANPDWLSTLRLLYEKKLKSSKKGTK